MKGKGKVMFCSRCGTQVPEEAKFCSKCGGSFVKQCQELEFTLTINRASQWYLINPAIKIVVDNGTSYKVENGGSIVIPVKAGIHNIGFYCSIRNKIVEVNVTRNVILNIGFDRITGSIEVNGGM